MGHGLKFLGIMVSLGVVGGCYDKPQPARVPSVSRSCVEYMVKGNSRTCVGYKFSQNPLAVPTQKIAVLLETPRQSEYFWAFDEDRQEMLLEDRPRRSVRECSFGLVLRTLVGPEKNADPLPVIIFDTKDDRTPGDMFNLKKLCGILSVPASSTQWLVASTQDKCPEEPTAESLSACLPGMERSNEAALLWDGEKAKTLFEKSHQFYLEAYIGTR